MNEKSLKRTEAASTKQSILSYIAELKDIGAIRRTSDLFPDLIDALNKNQFKPNRRGGSDLPPNEYVKQDLKNLSVRPGSPLVLSTLLCDRIAGCLQHIDFSNVGTNDRLRIYQRHFSNRKHSVIDNYSGQHLFKPTDAVEDKKFPLFSEDYLLYRVEARPTSASRIALEARVSKSFVRFYTPEDGGLRFLMLPFTYDNNFLAAKGWVDDLEKSYLLTGQIIDRRGPTLSDERIFGGSTIMAIRSQIDAPFVCYRETADDRVYIEAAPTVNFRVLLGKMPSVSRGYLVRAHGLKGMGGNKNQSAADRYVAMRDLQSFLFEKFNKEPTLEAAAKELSEITGFKKEYFFNFDEASGARGILVNLPFRGSNIPAQSVEQNHLTSADVWPLALPDARTPFWATGPDGAQAKLIEREFGIDLM